MSEKNEIITLESQLEEEKCSNWDIYLEIADLFEQLAENFRKLGEREQ